MNKHECPYDGKSFCPHGLIRLCGYDGYLCHMCREDRADARADKLEAISTHLSNIADLLLRSKP